MTTGETTDTMPRVTMEEITALAKRRGFIFQSSEIYGGIGGFFDYGPLGAILKRNVKDAWWRETVELRDDVVGFDSSIIMHPQTWVASGHVAAFHTISSSIAKTASIAFAPIISSRSKSAPIAA